MKILIAEDDSTSRFLLEQILKDYGEVNIVFNGREAVRTFESALEKGDPYRLIIMDIMMPELDGHAAVREIRAKEEELGVFSGGRVKIIMSTALEDVRNMMEAYANLCDGYMVKPINRRLILAELKKVGLVE